MFTYNISFPSGINPWGRLFLPLAGKETDTNEFRSDNGGMAELGLEPSQAL